MNRRERLAVLGAMLAVLGVPLLTAHPVLSHTVGLSPGALTAEMKHGSVMALFALLGIAALPLMGALMVAVRWLRAQRTMRAIAAGAERQGTATTTYFLVPSAGITFFTLGVLRPRIFASTGAYRQLSAEVFEAGIQHEREHVRNGDPAWRFVLAMLDSAFRPIPAVRRAVAGLALACELAADRGALGSGARPEHLFEAMVAATAPVPAPSTGLAAVGVVERLEVLTAATEIQRNSSVGGLTSVVVILLAVPITAHGLFWLGAVCL